MRDDILTITTERYGLTTTIYVAGVLRISSVVRIVRTCDTLAPAIRLARLDLRAVHAVEDGALTLLETRLRHWRRPLGRVLVARPDAGESPPGSFRTSTR